MRLSRQPVRQRKAGMTLVEVVISMAIAGLAMGGIVAGYTHCATAADRAGLYLAANARAMERLEETRSAQWLPASWPAIDQLVASNFPNKSVTLDMSGAGVAIRPATIQTTIVPINGPPGTPPLKRIRVDCIWSYKGRTITTSVETCRAPDQ